MSLYSENKEGFVIKKMNLVGCQAQGLETWMYRVVK